MIEKNIQNDQHIDLNEIFSILWLKKIFILTITFVASISSVFYSLSLSNIYRSEAILFPVTHESSSFGNNSSLGTLANLTGVTLPSSSDNKTQIALEVLKSKQFFSDFNSKHNILVDLMASYDWDPATNTLVFDDEVYDQENNKWLREVSFLRDSIPTTQEAHAAFMDIFNAFQDPKSGFIYITLEHFSPYISKEWLRHIIDDINETIRQNEIKNAELAITYLEDEALQTNIAEVRSGLYKLIESHTQKKVIARATPEYVFQIIDPPTVPEQKIKPRRAIICILGAMLGFVVACILSLIHYFYFKPQKPF